MAFPDTYINGRFLHDALTGTTFNLDTNTIRGSLFTDAVSGADKNAAETYNSGAWASTNELGTAVALSNPGITTPASGEWSFRDGGSSTLLWTGVTGTVAGVLIYSVTASNRVIAAFKLPAPVALVAGDFLLTWDSGAIFKVAY